MKKVLLPALLFCFATFGFAETRQIFNNFHEVDHGKFYRSARLSPANLENTVKQYKIKTVINLQGAHPDDDWYIEEKQILDNMDVELVDIPMRSERIPTREELQALLETYDQSERPILIHCNSGSDRTGEAAAIYEMEYMHRTKEQAMEQLSPKFFHFSFLVPSKTYFMDLYQGKKWAMTQYDPCKQKYLYFDQHRECHHRFVFVSKKDVL